MSYSYLELLNNHSATKKKKKEKKVEACRAGNLKQFRM